VAFKSGFAVAKAFEYKQELFKRLFGKHNCGAACDAGHFRRSGDGPWRLRQAV